MRATILQTLQRSSHEYNEEAGSRNTGDINPATAAQDLYTHLCIHLASVVPVVEEMCPFMKKELKLLGKYGITEKDIKMKYDELHSQNSNASISDAAWAIANQLIIQFKDTQTLKMFYYELALYLNDRGQDSTHIQKICMSMELPKYKKYGITKVSILSAGSQSCDACRKMHGQTYDIDYAIKNMPLPCENCTTIIGKGKKGFCRCLYQPVIQKI